MKEKALMLASVASMIDQFNMRNIKILQEMGYKVEAVCNFEEGNTTNEKRLRRFKKELKAKGVEFYQVPIPRKIKAVGSIIRSYFMVKRLVKSREYKIVHCHSPIGGVIARLACRNERKKGTKVVYTAHGFHFYKGASMASWLIFYSLERFCSKFTDVIITINEEDYKRAKRFKAKKTEYVPGVGIDTERIKAIAESREEIKESLGLKRDAFVLISVGQLSKRKNHSVIIKALAEIKDRDIYYVICGLGELEKELKDLSAELGIGDRVIFTGYRNDIKRLLHGADVFVFPSVQEGLPVSLMEAMAAGLACTASKIRGNTDLLRESGSDCLVDVFDADGYKRIIESFYDDREYLRQCGLKNLQAVKKFDKAAVDEKMREIYSELDRRLH